MNFPDSIPPLDNNSIPVGFNSVRSKPFMEFDPNNPDYEGAENWELQKRHMTGVEPIIESVIERLRFVQEGPLMRPENRIAIARLQEALGVLRNDPVMRLEG